MTGTINRMFQHFLQITDKLQTHSANLSGHLQVMIYVHFFTNENPSSARFVTFYTQVKVYPVFSFQIKCIES